MSYTDKLVIIGDSGIGKTCLLQRINHDEFTEDHNPTILDSFYRNIDHNGETRRIRSVDTAGHHDHDHLRYVATPNGRVVIIAFSMVDRDSFDNIKKKWLPEKKKAMRDAKIILIGTKSDLVAEEGQEQTVSTRKGVRLAKRIHALGYWETSAKTGEGVKEAFAAATEALLTPPTYMETMKTKCCCCVPFLM